jgi:hypothetical protein
VVRVDTIFVIHEDRDMGRNVTFRLDDETLRRTRVKAAERGISLSKLVSEIIERNLRRYSPEYEKAMREDLAEMPYLRSNPSKPYLKREQLYDRPGKWREQRLQAKD